MSLLISNFIMKGNNGKEIIFSRPFLNDERELLFLHCSEFLPIRFPGLQFVLNEERKAIEVRNPNSKKQVYILLTGENAHIYEQACKAKQEILDGLKKYTQSLKTGKEKILVFETGVKDCPYYFTSTTIQEGSIFTVKYEKGLMYFLNEQAKKVKTPYQFEDFMETQKKLSTIFAEANPEKYRVKNSTEPMYEMIFGELLQLVA